MRKMCFMLAVLSLGACSGNLVPGESEGKCDRNPESCMSVREAIHVSDGPTSPQPSHNLLQRGDVMRVWVAPMRDQNGVLAKFGPRLS